MYSLFVLFFFNQKEEVGDEISCLSFVAYNLPGSSLDQFFKTKLQVLTHFWLVSRIDHIFIQVQAAREERVSVEDVLIVRSLLDWVGG